MSIIFLMLFLASHNPNYCSCEPLAPINNEQYDSYNLIVKGKVSKVVVSNFKRTIYISVNTYYKGGTNQPLIKIVTPSQSGECGIFPSVGEEWLFFAYLDRNDFRTELCTRTKNLSTKSWNYNKTEIEDDIKFLEGKLKSNKP